MVDCEMAELLINRYVTDLDWANLKAKAALPENDTLKELQKMKERVHIPIWAI